MNNTPYFFLGGFIIIIFDTWGARIYTAKRGIPPIELTLLVTIVLCLMIFALGLGTNTELGIIVIFALGTAIMTLASWLIRPRLGV